MSTTNKFGTDDNEEITPFYDHNFNLDDLENVSGFNVAGKKNVIYGFKLNNNGIYRRTEVNLEQEQVFNTENVKQNKPHTIIYKDNKLKLIETDIEWDIDIKIENNMVTYRPTDNKVLKVFNSGKIFGNLIPEQTEYLNATELYREGRLVGIRTKHGKERSSMLFSCTFQEDEYFLREPTEDSTFVLEGFINSRFEDNEIIPGLTIQYTQDIRGFFRIIIYKNRNDFQVISNRDTMIKTVGEIRLDRINLLPMYMVTRILFSQDKIPKQSIILS